MDRNKVHVQMAGFAIWMVPVEVICNHLNLCAIGNLHKILVSIKVETFQFQLQLVTMIHIARQMRLVSLDIVQVK